MGGKICGGWRVAAGGVSAARFHPGKATEARTLCKWVFTEGGEKFGSPAAGSAKRPDHFYRN